MRLLIASDHAGYTLKNKLYAELKKRGFDIVDLGPFDYDPDDDYPDFVAPLAAEISDNTAERGIVIGGSGQGEAIMCNRFPNVRAVVFNGQYSSTRHPTPPEIKIARAHNDANVLSLGARFLDFDEAFRAVLEWLNTPFSGDERHLRRIRKIEQLAPEVVSKKND
jgi:ribose 5-phosphate isomerase B